MTTNTNAASVAAVIAYALAELDGYDPKDQHCGLYDLRWSGGSNPEPEGDAWHMDYLPKAEKIAAALASPGAVAAEQPRTSRHRPTTMLKELGFALEERAGVWVVQEDAGGCYPANLTERVLWKALVEMCEPRERTPLRSTQGVNQ